MYRGAPITRPSLLRVANQLWAADFDIVLDGLDKRIYHSVMKQVDEVNVLTEPDVDTSATGATLFTFLDVAERLYMRIAEALKAAGLSYAKYDVLDQLRRAGNPLHLRALAEGQGCAASNITQLIDRLEGEGLVKRIDDPEDRRSVRAQITPQGLMQVEEGRTQIDVVRAQFAASFTAAERVQLAQLLAKIK